MTTQLSGTAGVIFPDASTQNTAATGFGFKNRIINGAMMIDQRNAGASVTPTTDAQYTLDRWNARLSSASKYSVQQGTASNPYGVVKVLIVTSLAATSVAAGDFYAISQPIEGNNIADLSWGTAGASPVTLSFWVRSSLTGTFGGAIRNAVVNRSYPFSYTIASANSWQQISVTIPGDTTGTWATDNSVGMYVFFGLGMGSTYSGAAGSWASANYLSATGAKSVVGTNGATFLISNVQLEKGSTATSFDYRPYGTELALCQRYYYKLFPQATTSHLGVGFCNSTTAAPITGTFPVTMRIAPTALEQSGTAGDYAIVSGSSSMLACSAVPAFSVPTNAQVFQTSFTVASGLTVGQGAVGRTGASTGANGYLAWSAEL